MIVIPWTRRPSQQLVDHIAEWDRELYWVGDSDESYWRLLRDWWVSMEPELFVIEHDIVPSRELVKEMKDCPEPYCAAVYPFEGFELYGLGCTKFDLEVRQKIPDLFEQISNVGGGEIHPPRHWCSLDHWMQNFLRHVQPVHVHHGAIEHHNEIRSHVACRPSH